MLAVVTGGSRGLGAALIRALIARGGEVVAAARGPAPLSSDWLHWSSVDLADLDATAAWIDTAMAALRPQAGPVALILNAGMVEPLCAVRDLAVAETDRALRLNLAGPMLTTAGFLRATDGWGVERRVLAISSGAGRHGIPHWAAYCASKSGLDGFIRALASEPVNGSDGPVRAVSIAPGVVDTAMQEIVRTRDTPTRSRFQGLFEAGALVGADAAAAHLLDYLDDAAFGASVTDDLRDVIARTHQA